MIKNHFKIAWRNLLKNKGYAFINIFGLAIGMACCLLIGLYIQDELSYDQYHKNKDRIYRVLHGYSQSGVSGTATVGKATDYHYQVWGNAPVGKALKADFPEVQEVAQFSGQVSMLLKNGERVFQEENVFFADPSVLKIFSWPLVAGDPKTALTAPYSAVLTESMAKKYFGDENPIGKTLEGGNTGGRADTGTYTVTGVMKDIPSNSHFRFDFLMSMSSFKKSWAQVFDQWGYVDFYTYFLVPEGYDISQLSSEIPDFLKRHHATDNGRYNIQFEPMLDAYLHSTAERQPGPNGNLQNLYIFGIVGLFILCIACVNFMNLATSRSMERAKEVGIRKVIGADRRELMLQFLGESLVMVFLAAFIAFLAVLLLLPGMEAFSGKQLPLSSLINRHTLLIFLPMVGIIGILAGSYPALVLSGFKPIIVLKGAFKTSAKGSGLRKGLVIFQFSLSIALIAGTAIVFSQLNHLQHVSMGFQKDQMLVVDFGHDSKVINSLDAIKNTLLQEKDVISVTASRSVPGSYFPNAGTEIESPDGQMRQESPALFEMDVDFIPNFGLEMAAGRAYSKDFPADTAHSLVINEAMAKLYGYPNPKDIIGKRFSQWGKEGQVIGVVKDFNYLSLHQRVQPLALRFAPESSTFFTLHIRSADMSETLTKLTKIWSALVPQRPFIYNFLDDSFNRQYEADFRFRSLFTIFSGLAVLIACLGLLGLATYTTQLRIKEIGVRKVLGASVGSIVRLLSLDFVKLILIAMLIATPLGWWAMDRWLQDFAYHIDIHWWIFALAGIAAVVAAVITISSQAIRAAVANPIDSLRNE